MIAVGQNNGSSVYLTGCVTPIKGLYFIIYMTLDLVLGYATMLVDSSQVIVVGQHDSQVIYLIVTQVIKICTVRTLCLLICWSFYSTQSIVVGQNASKDVYLIRTVVNNGSLTLVVSLCDHFVGKV